MLFFENWYAFFEGFSEIEALTLKESGYKIYTVAPHAGAWIET